MTELAPSSNASSGLRRFLWLLAPLLVLAIAIAWIAAADPLRSFNNGAPPVETITFERTVLNDGGIRVQIRAGGSEDMTVAQVQVDDAYWNFSMAPAGPLARGSTAWIDIPYPWVLGEAHRVKLVTNTGTTFEHEIAVAVPTPVATQGQLVQQAIVGAIVGILPVAIGLMFYPAMRNVGTSGMGFVLALTVGLLAFLLVDMTFEALELAAESAPLFQGPAMVILAALATFLILMGISRRGGRPEGLALAFYIAFGIGLHNFGEGLAIGAAFATGSAGLGTFLVLGFAIHNVTEGIGIAAPIVRQKPHLWAFVALTLVAGAPAVLGMWIGSLAYGTQWSALALGVGAGAILQVMVEVTAFFLRGSGRQRQSWLSPPVLSGFLTGVAFMYVTAAVIKV
ncbi:MULTISPECIES: ZIP family metal transporter [Devosia]|uniref:ZIP family metal transporter n=1 Tax=Devosia salina TaxID=2860336 RepID=A0ABX8WCC4_9HYPH|nr:MULTISPECIES: ZIP family metal transporter [Devosia]AVF05108.1 metal transporter [Devosia sp. I507]QYO76585.1 ZIP family metal transporter [Devosia salina]